MESTDSHVTGHDLRVCDRTLSGLASTGMGCRFPVADAGTPGQYNRPLLDLIRALP